MQDKKFRINPFIPLNSPLCLPVQAKLTAIVAKTKIIPNPFPHPLADRNFGQNRVFQFWPAKLK